MFIHGAYRALPVNCEFTLEGDKLLSNQYILRCLSIHAAMGYTNKYKARSFASNIPWTIIQIRHVAMIYGLFLQCTKGAQGEPPDPGMFYDFDDPRLLLIVASRGHTYGAGQHEVVIGLSAIHPERVSRTCQRIREHTV
jgi:hypothetical protein